MSDRLLKSNMRDRFSEPTEVLYIGFPASLKVDDLSLRKEFAAFEVEKITTFHSCSYAFVKFKNVMEACKAKEALQGKLLDNPCVRISFGKRESETSKNRRNIIRFPRGAFERRGFQQVGSEVGLSSQIYEHRPNPTNRGAHFVDFSAQQFPPNYSLYDDSLDLPEDSLLIHGAKKLKTSSLPPIREFPEYPLSDSKQVKHFLPRIYPDFPQPVALDKKCDSGPFGYKQIPDHAMHIIQPYGERSNSWNASYGSFVESSVPLPCYPTEWKSLTPDSNLPSLSEGWKWEGTIAKKEVCLFRARCFPVGIPLDINLPEILDCTERTNLDIFSQHYSQAASAWVVFFVPAGHTDIKPYNECVEYLIKMQRVWVSKLDYRTALFFVPPSEFSEKVLKVPVKSSISGVALRLNFESANGDTSYPKPVSTVVPSASVSGHAPIVGMPLEQNKPPVSSCLPMVVLQPELLAQLTSSLLAKDRQSTGVSMANGFRQSGPSNFNQVKQQLQQQLPTPTVPTAPQRELHTGALDSQTCSAREEVEADPEKRLQETLALASALLRQIQQGKGT